MRVVFLIGLFMAGGMCSAQTASVPTVILDSMIFEVKLGRQCGITLEAVQAENKAMANELLHTGTALTLSQSSNGTLSALLANARDYSGILTQQFTLDKNKLKAKIKRLWFWVVSEGVFIIVMVLLI